MYQESFWHYWQDLVGAIIGAVAGVVVPIALYVLAKSHEKRKIRKENLQRLEKIILLNINATIEVKKELLRFVNTKLNPLIDQVKQRNLEKVYSVDVAYVPLVYTGVADINIFDTPTESNYVENCILEVFMMTKNFSLEIEDLRQQYSDVIQTNRVMAFSKLSPGEEHNRAYVENLENFKKQFKKIL